MMDARLKAILGAYLGWVMDGYDALLVVPILSVLGQEFFPGEYAYLGGLSTLVATLVMRPAGAVVMGYVGDKLGRRIGLLITTLGYSLAALLIAATPSYAQIGALAPAVVLALRAAQGLFLGGEWGPGTALIMEWSRRRGEIASAFAQTGYPLGVVAANLVYSAFSAAGALGGAGWRLYMVTGAAAALLAFVVRSKSVESPAWRRPRANPLALLFKAKSADLAKAVVMTTGLFLVYYSTYLIYPTFLKYLKLQALAPSVMLYSTAAAAAAVFLGGALAVPVGATPIFLGSLVASAAYAPYVLLASPSPGGLVLLAFVENLPMGLVPYVLHRKFDVGHRASAFGVAYNWGLLAGGWAPLLAALAGQLPLGMTAVMLAGAALASLGYLATRA